MHSCSVCAIAAQVECSQQLQGLGSSTACARTRPGAPPASSPAAPFRSSAARPPAPPAALPPWPRRLSLRAGSAAVGGALGPPQRGRRGVRCCRQRRRRPRRRQAQAPPLAASAHPPPRFSPRPHRGIDPAMGRCRCGTSPPLASAWLRACCGALTARKGASNVSNGTNTAMEEKDGRPHVDEWWRRADRRRRAGYLLSAVPPRVPPGLRSCRRNAPGVD